MSDYSDYYAADLRTKAEFAQRYKPGRWYAHAFGVPGDEEPTSTVIHTGPFDWDDLYYPDGTSAVAWLGCDSDEVAQFIAAANPDMVIGLLDYVDQLKDAVLSAYRHNEREQANHDRIVEAGQHEHAEARARAERMEATIERLKVLAREYMAAEDVEEVEQATSAIIDEVMYLRFRKWDRDE